MLDRIKKGTRPTEILREIIAENPSMRNFDLSREFCGLFEGISMDAIQAIWHWKGGGRVGGYDDEELDAILLKALREGGFI